MNEQWSQHAASMISHWAEMAKGSIESAAAHFERPSVLYRPSIYIDGVLWCALYGDDLQSGVAGFGSSPAEAMSDFDRNWYTNLKGIKGGDMNRKIVDDEGENLAVRMFLVLYGGQTGITTQQMRLHLEMAGFKGAWPLWATADGHLTKAGAQLWIRHLFSLEQPAQKELESQG